MDALLPRSINLHAAEKVKCCLQADAQLQPGWSLTHCSVHQDVQGTHSEVGRYDESSGCFAENYFDSASL